jgi:nucleoside-diphosphate-sugar epimerase
MSNRALVTGGCGFIGSNLVNRLIDSGWEVDVVDDLSNGRLKFIPPQLLDDHFWAADFSSSVVLEKIRSGAYDYVFHLAANPRVSYSVEHPIESNDTNVSKSLRLIDACKGNVKRFIFASSSAVYGNTKELPTNESAVLDPESPYGLQKLLIEQYLRLYWKLHSFDSACLRFFNVFGKNQLGNSPYSTAVSAWLTAIKSGKKMRSDGDGTQSRDMCHVDNVVDAMIRAALCEDQLKGEAFNVACGENFTNNQILEKIKSFYPFSESYDAPPRHGDVKATLADVSKIKKVLGYEPIVRFWDGLQMTVDWFENCWEDVKE